MTVSDVDRADSSAAPRPARVAQPVTAAGAGRAPGAGRLRANAVEAAAWLCLGVAALAVSSIAPGDGTVYGTVGLSAAAVLFGLRVFWRHGGNTITATGIYNFSFALFVGFGGLYQVAYPSPGATVAELGLGVGWCYLLQVTTWLFFWSDGESRDQARIPHTNPVATRWAVWFGVALLAMAVAVPRNDLGSDMLSVLDAVGFSGTVLVGVGLLLGPGGRHWFLCGIAILVAFGVYVIYLFDGFGRIVLASLGFALLIILARRAGGRLVKAAVLIGAAPTLFVLAKMRVRVVEQLRPGADENGLESIVGPVHQFARLLTYDDAGYFAYGWGHTFWSSLVALVPRRFWPEKPVGFGSQIVSVLTPDLVGTGHSDAALFFGEWLFNFGVAGLFLMVPMAGLLLRGLDRMLAWATRMPIVGRRDAVRYAGVVVAAAGVIDVVWIGTFSYMARTGSRLLVLLLVLAVLIACTGGLKRRPRAAGNIAGDARPQQSPGGSMGN